MAYDESDRAYAELAEEMRWLRCARCNTCHGQHLNEFRRRHGQQAYLNAAYAKPKKRQSQNFCYEFVDPRHNPVTYKAPKPPKPKTAKCPNCKSPGVETTHEYNGQKYFNYECGYNAGFKNPGCELYKENQQLKKKLRELGG